MRAHSLSVLPLGLVIAGCSASKGAQTGDSSTASVPSSQSAYEYAGCRNENGGCPRLLTLACALRTIASKYNNCTKHEDCVQAAFDPKCSGAGTCPPYFVNGQLKQSFEEDAQREINSYCQTGDCTYSGLCGSFGVTPLQPYCASSHCTYIRVW